MAVAIDLSTAGIRVGYAFEATSGTKPTAFTNLPNPKNIPDMNPAPNALDSTSLNATEWKTYIQGLKDMGGSLGITFGMSQVFFDLWKTVVQTTETNKAENKRTWFVFYIPGIDESFFLTAEPAFFGMSEAAVDSVLDLTVNIIPTGEIGWAEAINPADPQ